MYNLALKPIDDKEVTKSRFGWKSKKFGKGIKKWEGKKDIIFYYMCLVGNVKK